MEMEIIKINTNDQGVLYAFNNLDTHVYYTKEELEIIKKNIEKAIENA